VRGRPAERGAMIIYLQAMDDERADGR